VRDEDGRAIADSGVGQTIVEMYHWPMRAAIGKLARAPARTDRPGMAVTLTTLARAGGDVASAADVLARRWPKMGDPATARAHFAFALNRVRAVYSEEAAPPSRKSTAQLDAEAA